MKSSNQNFLKNKSNFVYWHRTVIQHKHIKQALDRNVTIEVDLSFDEYIQKPYIGHRRDIYNSFFDKLFIGDSSKNISFDELIEYLNKFKLHVILDCKSSKVLHYLSNNINKINLENVIFHAFVKEWCLDKENRRYNECIKIEDIKVFREKTNTFWIGSSLVKNYNQIDSNVLKIISDTAEGIINGVSFFTHYYQLLFPKQSVYKKVSNIGYIPVFASDLIIVKPGFKYFGASNFINNCTINNYEK